MTYDKKLDKLWSCLRYCSTILIKQALKHHKKVRVFFVFFYIKNALKHNKSDFNFDKSFQWSEILISYFFFFFFLFFNFVLFCFMQIVRAGWQDVRI